MIAQDTIKRNLDVIWKNIQNSSSRSGRNPRDVTLVVVTKTVDVDTMRMLAELGITDIGENRVQDACRKYQQLRDCHFRWHMIGHLQTNKVRKALEFTDVIHSVDSVRLASKIDKEASKRDEKFPCLLEVNMSEETSKYGFSEERLLQNIGELSKFNHILVEGLMTMAPFTGDEKTIRRVFAGLRRCKDKVNSFGLDAIHLKHLSMGMTNDYPIAIEEGATIVRIGTAVFQGT